MARKFDPAKAAKLDDRGRLVTLDPHIMWDALGRPQVNRIVDIGAGTGLISAEFARLAPNALVYAVDTQPEMLQYLREHRKEAVIGQIVTVENDESSVPLDDSIADLVTMVNMHHELEDPAAMYAEAYRLLRGGGQLLAVDWKPIETPKGPPVALRSSAEDAAELVRAAGFAMVRSHEVLPEHWVLTGMRPT